jgi:hypothetical protein
MSRGTIDKKIQAAVPAALGPIRGIALARRAAQLDDFTIVTCATSIAPPRKPPSQYIR